VARALRLKELVNTVAQPITRPPSNARCNRRGDRLPQDRRSRAKPARSTDDEDPINRSKAGARQIFSLQIPSRTAILTMMLYGNRDQKSSANITPGAWSASPDPGFHRGRSSLALLPLMKSRN